MTDLPQPKNLTKPSESNSLTEGIDYKHFLDCVHCGLCSTTCPTYVVTGNENDSPRGRIYMMRAIADGRAELTSNIQHHLDLCLDCRSCETACPSGVQYGRLIEPFRVAMEKEQAASHASDWFRNWIMLGIFPYADRLRKVLWPARIAQALRLDRLAQATGLVRLLPTKLQRMVQMLPSHIADAGPLPSVNPAIGKKRATVALFTGCVADAMFRHTHWATVRVLQQNGCEVHVPSEQVCCGAIHFHTGESETAREFADQNIAALNLDKFDAVLVNVAGCGAMMKEYPHHWNDKNQEKRTDFSKKVKDINEFLDELGLIPPKNRVHGIATYHDACHLGHAQKITAAPRRLLNQVNGLELRPLSEAELCCGAAGSYNLTQPGMSAELSKRKLDRILETGVQVVITSNAGCLIQIEAEAKRQGKRLRILHPMEVLDMAYQEAPIEL